MAAPDAAVAIVYARGVADSVLLMRRSLRDADPWSGHWALPGGRCQPQDGGLVHTALRELAEECGICLAPSQLQSALPLANARRGVGHSLIVASFVFTVDAEHLPTLDPREAVEALWVPLTFLRDPARHALRPVPGQPAELLFPAIDLNGVPLWGFTYRLLTGWLGLNPLKDRMEQAGFQAAQDLLNVLVAHGCALFRPWEHCQGGMLAEVQGPIPVELILARASRPAALIPSINMLEVRPSLIRIVGLAFEEYLIRARA